MHFFLSFDILLKEMWLNENFKIWANVSITFRYSDGRAGRVLTHNIWLNSGRDWLLKLMSYGNNGITPLEDYRVYAVGFGIGGNKQIATIPSNVNTEYPGTNNQSGEDPAVTMLERPVRIKVDGGLDYWLQPITHASTYFNPSPPPYYVRYYATIGANEISYSPYNTVPLSEIGLFHKGEYTAHVNDTKANVYGTPPVRPVPLAYATFYSISKTSGVTLDIEWEIRLST